MVGMMEVNKQGDWEKVKAEIERQIVEGEGTAKERLEAVRMVIHEAKKGCFWLLTNNKRIKIDNSGRITTQQVLSDKEIVTIVKKSVKLDKKCAASDISQTPSLGDLASELEFLREGGRRVALCLWIVLLTILFTIILLPAFLSILQSGII